jgi:hypothetical protein
MWHGEPALEKLHSIDGDIDSFLLRVTHDMEDRGYLAVGSRIWLQYSRYMGPMNRSRQLDAQNQFLGDTVGIAAIAAIN